jgi:putative NADH-flavin reductase
MQPNQTPNHPPSGTRVLLLGATGNLGSRLVPALLAHWNTIIARVRSPEKLSSLLSPDLLSHPILTIASGSALNTNIIANTLREHDCNAIINAAGNQVPPWKEPVLGPIVKSVTDAVIQVGKERGVPLRHGLSGAWDRCAIQGLWTQGLRFRISKLRFIED